MDLIEDGKRGRTRKGKQEVLEDPASGRDYKRGHTLYDVGPGCQNIFKGVHEDGAKFHHPAYVFFSGLCLSMKSALEDLASTE